MPEVEDVGLIMGQTSETEDHREGANRPEALQGQGDQSGDPARVALNLCKTSSEGQPGSEWSD